MKPLEIPQMVLIPYEALKQIAEKQELIFTEIKSIKQNKLDNPQPLSRHITALEFMDAVRIARSKFDELVSKNLIKTIKKKRKIYVPISEIDRYFTDSSIK